MSSHPLDVSPRRSPAHRHCLGCSQTPVRTDFLARCMRFGAFEAERPRHSVTEYGHNGARRMVVLLGCYPSMPRPGSQVTWTRSTPNLHAKPGISSFLFQAVQPIQCGSIGNKTFLRGWFRNGKFLNHQRPRENLICRHQRSCTVDHHAVRTFSL